MIVIGYTNWAKTQDNRIIAHAQKCFFRREKRSNKKKDNKSK